MRIPTLLQKIAELSTQPERRTTIDIDLMLDYTRVLYADLLEWRSKLPATLEPSPANAPLKTSAVKDEPTLAELTDAMQTPAAKSHEPVPPAASQTPVANTSAHGRQDIRELIGINDKYQIISELFNNDKAAYEQALDYINQSGNERKALDWLREQLWITEERSETAQSFFEIVERFFAGK